MPWQEISCLHWQEIAASTSVPGEPAIRDQGDAGMKVYAGSDVRNVAIVGHAHSGKTELITAILKTAKSPAASSRENGGAVTMYDEEEIARNMSMSNAAAFAEWDGIKVNMLRSEERRVGKECRSR